jgi:hypothetical protein
LFADSVTFLQHFARVLFTLVADERQFVGDGDLHVAQLILDQFVHFSSVSVGAVQLTLYEFIVKLYGLFGGGFVETANHPVVVHQFINNIAWQHTLRVVAST